MDLVQEQDRRNKIAAIIFFLFSFVLLGLAVQQLLLEQWLLLTLLVEVVLLTLPTAFGYALGHLGSSWRSTPHDADGYPIYAEITRYRRSIDILAGVGVIAMSAVVAGLLWPNAPGWLAWCGVGLVGVVVLGTSLRSWYYWVKLPTTHYISDDERAQILRARQD